MVAKSGKTVVSADANADDEDAKKAKGAATEPDDTGAEDDDGKKAKKKAEADDEEDDAKVAAIVDRRLKAETDRCAGLHAVAEQASRMGVNFNAVEAITKGMSVATAREKVMSAAASGDADETSPIATPKKNAAQQPGDRTHTAEEKKAMWAKGFKRR